MGFPFDFSDATTWDAKMIYPVYRRLHPHCGGAVEEWEDSRQRTRVITNQWVVPHNRLLVQKYQCHINVQLCVSVRAIKYLFKYIHKGSDRAMVRLQGPTNDSSIVPADVSGAPEPGPPLPPSHATGHATVATQVTAVAPLASEPESFASRGVDEIKRYEDARVIGTSKAMWRMFNNDMFRRSPPIKTLQVHLENMQYTRWEASDAMVAVARDASPTLTHWL